MLVCVAKKNETAVLTYCESDSATVMFLFFRTEMHFLAIDTGSVIQIYGY